MQPLHIGHAADSLDDEIGREPCAVGEGHAIGVELLHADAEVEVGAVRLVMLLHGRTELGAQRADHRLGVERRHGDRAAELRRGRRHLAADEPRAHDEQARAGGELFAQVQRIIGRAQHGRLDPGHGQVTRADAAGDHQAVEGVRRIVDRHHPLGERAAGRASA